MQRFILWSIGRQTGAREQFFKLEEGSRGDLVCALYDDPGKKLRLYAIRYGKTTLILGGGGPKSKQIRAWQEDAKLKKHAEQMKIISNRIYKRMHEQELMWDKNFLDFEGNLLFKED